MKTISNAAKPERMEKLAERESELLDNAKKFNSKQFKDEVKSLTDEIDGDDGLSEDERAFSQRGFDLVKTDGLMKPVGNGFDQESGEIIATALAFEKECDFVKGDTRTIAQRNADAMRNICQWYLDHHADSTAKRSQPHVLLIHDVEQRGIDGELLKQARTEATHSDRVSKATVERMMCERRREHCAHRQSRMRPQRRTRQPLPHPRSMERPCRPRPRLRRLWAVTAILPSTSQEILGTRRTNRPRKPRTLVLAMPPKTTCRRPRAVRHLSLEERESRGTMRSGGRRGQRWQLRIAPIAAEASA